MNWYSKFTISDDGTGANGAGYVQQTFGSEFIFDLEASYEVNEMFTITAGAQNVLNNHPDKFDNRAFGLGPVYTATGARFTGDIYPDASPFGFNGGFWYLKAAFKF
jgi:iron complex outermembrane receptor protein